MLIIASGATATAMTRPDGGQLIVARPATQPNTSYQNPAFSPNSSKLFFTEYLCGYDAVDNCATNGGAMLEVPAAGGTPTTLYGDCSDPNSASCQNEPTNVNGLASWNGPTNLIVFAISDNPYHTGPANGDIATISGAGVGFRRVTHATKNSYLEPTFDPTGSMLTFQSDQLGDNDGDDDFLNHASLMLVRPNGTGLQTLVNGPNGTTKSDNRLPVWSPDGKLILFQRRTNFTDPNMPYNLFTISPSGGTPTQVTGKPGQPTFGGNDDSDASWSADGKWILDSASYYNANGEPNIWLVSADGKQLVRATNSTHEDGAPVMSRDGRWIYFESHLTDDNSVTQIWRIASPVRSDGSTQVFRPTTTSPVAATSPSAQNPCYVPNSSKLLFTDFTDGYNDPNNTGSAGLYSIAAGGSNPSSVVFHLNQSAVNLPGACYNAASGRIAYSSDVASPFSNTDNIWTSLPGSTNGSEHQLTCIKNPPGSALSADEPSWSRDGKTLTYELDNANNANVTTIWTIPASNNCASHPVAPTEIVPAPAGRCPGQQAPPADNHEPNWSPDGGRIVFQSSTSDAANSVNLWTVQPNGCGLTRITNEPNNVDTDASWSPDSSSIVYSTDFGAPTGIANLFIVKATANGAKTRLTSQCYYDEAPSWSPDGNWVSFESWPVPHNDNNDHPTSIWRIPATARPAAPSC